MTTLRQFKTSSHPHFIVYWILPTWCPSILPVAVNVKNFLKGRPQDVREISTSMEGTWKNFAFDHDTPPCTSLSNSKGSQTSRFSKIYFILQSSSPLSVGKREDQERVVVGYYYWCESQPERQGKAGHACAASRTIHNIRVGSKSEDEEEWTQKRWMLAKVWHNSLPRQHVLPWNRKQSDDRDYSWMNGGE